MYGAVLMDLWQRKPIGYDVPMEIAGWIIRTGSFGAARYWKVGEPSPERAAVIAGAAAGGGPATAISKIAAHHYSQLWTVVVGEAQEIWGRNLSGIMEGQVTFDTVVPEEGTSHIEGCYRIGDGDWKVFYFTTSQSMLSSTRHIGVRRDVTFQSGISGMDGILPAGTVLNKKECIRIISDGTGVDRWSEIAGPNSLILK